MSYVIVDVESDGPIPAEFSMVCIGAVLFDDALDKTLYGKTRPISDRFIPEALAISGFSRDQHLGFDDPNGRSIGSPHILTIPWTTRAATPRHLGSSKNWV
jgi:hypothetical protein